MDTVKGFPKAVVTGVIQKLAQCKSKDEGEVHFPELLTFSTEYSDTRTALAALQVLESQVLPSRA